MNRISKLGLLALLLVAAFMVCKDPENIDPEFDITVTTYAPTEIAATMAQCGGHVTVTGVAQIAELGICWDTEGNPVASGNHLSTNNTGEPFNCTISELLPETEYHVRAYALYESEYYYGQDLGFTTLPDNGGGNEPLVPEGALKGLFSVSESQQVRFSQGNLQYQASSNTWRFAESQTDCIGEGNANIGENYDGWIDLFGWATSGFNHGAVCYQPWSSSQDPHDYCAYGNPGDNLYSQSGQADWGYNAIGNGGNQNGLWRTLSRQEWTHLLENRATVSGIRFATACVDGRNGLLLFPDEWDASIYSITEPNNYGAAFSGNAVTQAEWFDVLEPLGVAFLPTTGYRFGNTIEEVNSAGCYWTSSTHSDIEYVYGFYFMPSKHRDVDLNTRCLGSSVRLVCDLR